jgi:alpha-L-rhamnosidase
MPVIPALALLAALIHSAQAACDIVVTHLSVDFLPSEVPANADMASFLPRVTDSRAPLLGWWLEAAAPSAAPRALAQSSYRIVVATSPSLLSSPDVWDSGAVPSPESVSIPYGGPALAAGARVFWAVSVADASARACARSAAGAWEVPPLAEADWRGAAWLTRDDPSAPPPSDCALFADDPAPLFRGTFSLRAPPGAALVRARLHVAGLGLFEPFLDGARVGDEALAPAWSDFNASVGFSTLDVTAALAGGAADGAPHALGVAAGRGWWGLAPLKMWGSKDFRAALPSGAPCVRALLLATFSDGSTAAFTTAPTAAWAVGASEVLFNDVYLGNRVDRRKEPVGWSAPGFDARGWAAPFAAPPPAGALRAPLAQPIRRQAPRALAQLSRTAAGVTLDAGAQVSGVCELCFAGGAAAGATITTLYGELLHKDGSVNGLTSVAGQVKNGNGGPCAPGVAWQTDNYTFRGDPGGECFAPRFATHSARYISVTGDAAAVAALDVARSQCWPVRVDAPLASSWASASPLFDAVHQAALTSQASNLVGGVVSDCPHRERLGYTGDALMAGEAFLANFDFAALLEKRLRDAVDAQRPNGGFTETAPFVGISDAGLGGDAGPIGWAAWPVHAAMWAHKYHGNGRAVAASYAPSAAFVAFLATAPAGRIEYGLGDWMALENKCIELTGRGFELSTYAEFANMSAVVGNASEAARWHAAAAAAAGRLNAQFLNASTGVYSYAYGSKWSGTQAAQAFPLFLGIVPPGATTTAARAALAAAVAARGGHLAVGAFGVKWLLMALVDAGLTDAAWAAAAAPDYPGFGFMLNASMNNLTSATTLWESWFASDNTYSHNHGMFASVDTYAFQALAGIQPHPAARGLDRILLKPAPPRSAERPLPWVNASLVTRRGVVAAAWAINASGGFEYTVCVPPGVDAEVWLPASGARAPVGACCGCVFRDQLW